MRSLMRVLGLFLSVGLAACSQSTGSVGPQTTAPGSPGIPFQVGQKVTSIGHAGWRHVEFQVINDSRAVQDIIQGCGGKHECFWKKLHTASRTSGSGVTAYTGGGNLTAYFQYINAATDTTKSILLTSDDVYTGPALIRLDANAAWVNVPILSAARGGRGTGMVVVPEAFFAGKDTLVCARSENIRIKQSTAVTKGVFAGQLDVECDQYDQSGRTGFAQYFSRKPNSTAYMLTIIRQG